MGAEGAKMFFKHPYLSGQWTEQSLCDSGNLSYLIDLNQSILVMLWLFYLLGNSKNERGNSLCWKL